MNKEIDVMLINPRQQHIIKVDKNKLQYCELECKNYWRDSMSEKTGEMKGKAKEMKGEIKGKTKEMEGEIKGKAKEAEGKIKGKIKKL